MIELKGVTYQYQRASRPALTGVSLTIQPGSIFTLIGPNGAGKTTLVRILSGLIIPSKGTARICGYDTIHEEYNSRKSIGLVLGDERTFYFRLSGRQNLEFFGGLLGLKRNEVSVRVDDVLDAVGLKKSAGLQFMKYSTGMRKRLNFARSLLADPDVYLLDEPNSGVDPESAVHLRNIMFDLRNRGKTILLTTHNLQEAELMSDQIGFLKEGVLLKTGKLSDFKKHIRKRRLSFTFDHTHAGRSNALDRTIERLREEADFDDLCQSGNMLQLSFNGSTNVNRILHLVSESPLQISSVNFQETTLEDIFLEMARGGDV